jgi:ABC-2 type transport system permease protein
MNNVIWLARKTIRTTFRKPSAWLIYFALPVIAVMFSVMVFGDDQGQTIRVGIVNQDGDEAVTQDVIAFVAGLRQVEVSWLNEQDMRREVAGGRLDGGVVFRAGFADSVRAGAPDGVEIVSVKGAPVTAYVKAMLDQRIDAIGRIGLAAGGDAAAFDAMYASYMQGGFGMESGLVTDDSSARVVTERSIGFLIMLMMFSATNMAEIILKERENRTFLRLMSSPISARTYVLANVLVNGAMLSLQIVIMLVFLRMVASQHSAAAFWEMFLALFLFALVAVALSLAIVAFSGNRKAFSALTNLIVTPTCLLAGCFFPASFMPEAVQKLSYFLPQRWLLDMTESLQNGLHASGLYLNGAVLIAFAALLALVAVYRFNRGSDLGQFV